MTGEAPPELATNELSTTHPAQSSGPPEVGNRKAYRLFHLPKRAWTAFWNWKPLPEVLAGTAIVLGTVAAVGAGSELLHGPTAKQAPHAADWLSAISTFWGAIATGLGAILTGGALAYAARTYEKQRQDRQEELADRRRAQASAVTLMMSRKEAEHEWDFELRNDSPIPIFSMNVVGVASTGVDTVRHYLNPVVSGPQGTYGKGETLPAHSTEEHSYAEFKDAANVEWRRYGDGRLVEEKLSSGNTNKGIHIRN